MRKNFCSVEPDRCGRALAIIRVLAGDGQAPGCPLVLWAGRSPYRPASALTVIHDSPFPPILRVHVFAALRRGYTNPNGEGLGPQAGMPVPREAVIRRFLSLFLAGWARSGSGGLPREGNALTHVT